MKLRHNRIFGALLIVGSLASCKKADLDSTETAALPVTVLEVQTSEVPRQLHFTGKVLADESVLLSTKLMGNIQQIPDAGQPVSKGETLIKISSGEMEAQLKGAQASVKKAQTAYQNTEKQFNRIARLHQKGSATSKELDDVTAALAIQRATVDAGEQRLDEILQLLKYNRLVAPLDGFVSRKLANEGDIATPGTPLLAISSLNQLKIEVTVPEFEIGQVVRGMPVTFEIAALPQETYNGHVDQIVPSSEYSGSQYRVIVRFDPLKGLKPGMYAKVTLLKGSQPKLLVPLSAIEYRGQLTGLYGINYSGEAMLRWVRLGSHYADKVEVLSGIDAGDKVIIEAKGRLSDGVKVAVLN